MELIEFKKAKVNGLFDLLKIIAIFIQKNEHIVISDISNYSY